MCTNLLGGALQERLGRHFEEAGTECVVRGEEGLVDSGEVQVRLVSRSGVTTRWDRDSDGASGDGRGRVTGERVWMELRKSKGLRLHYCFGRSEDGADQLSTMHVRH